MTSQLDFDPGDYHLRVMIEQMERDGRSEHAIEDAVRIASAQIPTKTSAAKNGVAGNRSRAFTRTAHRPQFARKPTFTLFVGSRRPDQVDPILAATSLQLADQDIGEIEGRNP
jgi:hypothetical protein